MQIIEEIPLELTKTLAKASVEYKNSCVTVVSNVMQSRNDEKDWVRGGGISTWREAPTGFVFMTEMFFLQ